LKRIDYPVAIRELVAQLKRMPGIGPRSAERIALWMVQSRDARPGEIAIALSNVTAQVRPCDQCGFFSTEPLCEICADETRSRETLCVVEQPTDILPLEHVGPEDLRIDSLMDRVKSESPTEIILALSSDVEGEATANYLAGLLKDSGISVTRIAQGMPAGGGLESADELTLSRALSGRRQVG